MSIRARLAKLEAKIAQRNSVTTMGDAEIAAACDAIVSACKETVFYVLTHPAGCFVPPVAIGRTVDEISLSEIASFENVEFARIEDIDREIIQILLEAERQQGDEQVKKEYLIA